MHLVPSPHASKLPQSLASPSPRRPRRPRPTVPTVLSCVSLWGPSVPPTDHECLSMVLRMLLRCSCLISSRGWGPFPTPPQLVMEPLAAICSLSGRIACDWRCKSQTCPSKGTVGNFGGLRAAHTLCLRLTVHRIAFATPYVFTACPWKEELLLAVKELSERLANCAHATHPTS